jgi:hypothetical protein
VNFCSIILFKNEYLKYTFLFIPYFPYFKKYKQNQIIKTKKNRGLTLAYGMQYFKLIELKGGVGVEKIFKVFPIFLIAGFLSLISTPAFARSVSMKDAGIALWIFVIIGAIIVLLQLIPAAILFFTFIGTSAGLIVKKKAPEKAATEDKASVPGYEPVVVQK